MIHQVQTIESIYYVVDDDRSNTSTIMHSSKRRYQLLLDSFKWLLKQKVVLDLNNSLQVKGVYCFVGNSTTARKKRPKHTLVTTYLKQRYKHVKIKVFIIKILKLMI